LGERAEKVTAVIMSKRRERMTNGKGRESMSRYVRCYYCGGKQKILLLWRFLGNDHSSFVTEYTICSLISEIHCLLRGTVCIFKYSGGKSWWWKRCAPSEGLQGVCVSRRRNVSKVEGVTGSVGQMHTSALSHSVRVFLWRREIAVGTGTCLSNGCPDCAFVLSAGRISFWLI